MDVCLDPIFVNAFATSMLSNIAGQNSYTLLARCQGPSCTNMYRLASKT